MNPQLSNNEPLEGWERVFARFFYALLAVVGLTIIYLAVSASINRGTFGKDAGGVALLIVALLLLGLLIRMGRGFLVAWQSKGFVHHFLLNFLLLAIFYLLLPVWRALWYGPGIASPKGRLVEVFGFSLVGSIMLTAFQRTSEESNKS